MKSGACRLPTLGLFAAGQHIGEVLTKWDVCVADFRPVYLSAQMSQCSGDYPFGLSRLRALNPFPLPSYPCYFGKVTKYNHSVLVNVKLYSTIIQAHRWEVRSGEWGGAECGMPNGEIRRSAICYR